MGWVNTEQGAEYRTLGVTIPRLDDTRKHNYHLSVGRYEASRGQLMAIDDVTGDQIRSIDEQDARTLREAARRAREEEEDARTLRATTMTRATACLRTDT